MDSDLVSRVVIDGWDKLIVRPDGLELYDLKNDLDDRVNLAAQNLDKVKKLSALMEDQGKRQSLHSLFEGTL